MDDVLNNALLNGDENARDEFSSQYYFKSKRFGLRDITNEQINSINIPIPSVKKSILSDSPNIINSTYNLKETYSRKRKVSGIFDDIRKKSTNICPGQSYQNGINTEPVSIQLPLLESLSELNNEYNNSESVISLSTPASGYNDEYDNHIVVPEPRKCEKLVKIEHSSGIWNTMMSTAKVESRILSTPCRSLCSPTEEYSLTPKLQYRSNCLIQMYHSNTDDLDLFHKAIGIDAVNKISHEHPNQSHTFMPESVNFSHFHALFLEKLSCNQFSDFMPQNSDLTGSILGSFINGLFELSRFVYLPTEVIHCAVDYIYQYLSRVKDVPLNDMRLVTLGAIWVASKCEGLQWLKEICHFTDCSPSQLKHAELRLFSVIDCNLIKNNAIHFRNRFIVIESSTSIVAHISSFILDMSLHCYTVMILPSSKRAAAALWLARLIEKFQDIGLCDDEDMDFSNNDLRDIMLSVWPDHFHKLTGYHHSEIAQLAIRLHIVVLAFLCRGQQKNPSVNACYNKYSNDTYKNLTGSYEKFTSQIVYFGTELYCQMYNLVSSEWLERNEFETLRTRFTSSKPSTRRYHSVDGVNSDVVSCPELTSKPIFRRIITTVTDEVIVASDKSKLLKLDSGYGTCSN